MWIYIYVDIYIYMYIYVDIYIYIYIYVYICGYIYICGDMLAMDGQWWSSCIVSVTTNRVLNKH